MKEAQDRIDASVERIGAKNIAAILPVTASDIDGVAVVSGASVMISAKFALEAESELLDKVVAHEICHAAFFRKEDVLPLINEISLEAFGVPKFDPDSQLGKSVMAFVETADTKPLVQDMPMAMCSRESWDRVSKLIEDAEAGKIRR